MSERLLFDNEIKNIILRVEHLLKIVKVGSDMRMRIEKGDS